MKNTILPVITHNYSNDEEVEKLISSYIKIIKEDLKKEDKYILFNVFKNIILLENFCKEHLGKENNYTNTIKQLNNKCKELITLTIKKEFQDEICCHFKKQTK